MNAINYEGVVFPRDATRLHRAADRSLRRFAGANRAVRIKESSFCLRALRATLAQFPDGGGKVDVGPCPDNLLGGE
jgi:hypothetical protein